MKNHFGFKLPEGIVGELSTFAPYRVSSGAVSQEWVIPFGKPVTTLGGAGFDKDSIIPYVEGLGRPLLGFSLYNPENTTGDYPFGKAISILEEGDIRLVVVGGITFQRGQKAYITVDGSGSDMFVTNEALGAQNPIGYFTTSATTPSATPVLGVKNTYIISIRRF